MHDWVSQFQAQFGDAVTTDTAGLLIQGIQPVCACAPSDEAQAAAIIRFAAAHKIPVVPCGGGTAQESCAPPPSGFLALSIMHLDKLIHHEPGDMVATVQGGMKLGDFQKAIGARGQWLPIDAPDAATIGGIVARNAYGPRALGYGTLRDMLLGMRVINGDGVARKCGGKVVKNVTGYALDKLYIGSYGTLGIVTEATFKLRSLPECAQTWSAGVPSIGTGVELLRAIAAKKLPLDLLQLASRRPNFTISKNFDPTIYVFACGTEAELRRIDSEIRSAVPVEIEVSSASAGAGAAFDMGQNCGAIGFPSRNWTELQTGNESGATLRFGCVSSTLNDALAILNAYEKAPMSIGMNGGFVELSPLNETAAARIASEFEKLGVNFAFENIVGVNIPNRWGTPRPEWVLMKQIKAALDPQGILNPGRFVC